jgi:hypothetical protein
MFGICSRRFSMDVATRPGGEGDIRDLVELAVLAWESVFRSFAQALGPSIDALRYPDWRKRRQNVVERVCAVVTGYIAFEMNLPEGTGEVDLLAAHPDHQNRGFVTELNTCALGKMREPRTAGRRGDWRRSRSCDCEMIMREGGLYTIASGAL